MFGRLMASPTTPLPVTLIVRLATWTEFTILAELKSAGRTTPRTVIDCLSELTPMSLVPSITRFPLDWTSTTRAEIVVDKVKLREVVPEPASSVSFVAPSRLVSFGRGDSDAPVMEALTDDLREEFEVPLTTADAASFTTMVTMSFTSLARTSRAESARRPDAE